MGESARHRIPGDSAGWLDFAALVRKQFPDSLLY
jgi:hypothetical protein